MWLYLTIAGVALATLLSLFFSSLTYSLREYSRPKLADFLGRRDGDGWFEPITRHASDLVFLTAVGRQFANILIFVLVFASFEQTTYGRAAKYGMTIVVAGLIAVFFSITVPHAAARYAGAQIVGYFAPFLNLFRVIFSPFAKLMHGTDDVVRRAMGASNTVSQTRAEEEILEAVEVGEERGLVDEQEREMIESVIEFRGITVGHAMTTRQEIVALNTGSTLDDVKRAIEESGHSRIPVYEGSVDHIVGILHARDLIKHLGIGDLQFSVPSAMRPAIYVPETKPLRDLLKDFRLQKIHIAIVLDEYGVTSGLVTIEDILEELVGDISDEHEPHEPAMFKRIDDAVAEADAKIHIAELNRLAGISLPEDAGYETLSGFLSTALARIPEKGTSYEHEHVRYTILDAAPQRINRVKIERLPQTVSPAAEPA